MAVETPKWTPVCGREDLLARRGFELVVFRADEHGKIISGFPASKLGRGGESVYGRDFKGLEVYKYIQKMLAGYSRTPFLIGGVRGCSMIVRSMVPAANICAALIFFASEECVCALAASGAFDLVVLPAQPGGDFDFLGGHDYSGAAEVERAYGFVKSGFYGYSPEYMRPGNRGTQRLFDLIRGLAFIACCAAECRIDYNIFNAHGMIGNRFDWDIFTVFTFLSLLACGRVGIMRDARIFCGVLNREIITDIETEVYCRSEYTPELEECQRIADRRRMLFEFSVIKKGGGYTLKIRFSPVRYEWSALGIKSANVFDFR